MSAGSDAIRVHYIDWLRVLAVLLLFPFHTGRVFNAGELFYSKSPTESVAVSMVLGFIDYWHMPLLFLLAGASTYFALQHRSIGHYVRERSLRLLVPLVFGTLVLVPPQTWYGARTNDGYTGSYLDYLSTGRFLEPENLFGRGDYYGGLTPAHLWFIMFLWLISMIVLPLLAVGRTERGRRLYARLARILGHPASWILVALAALVGDALPELGVSNPVYYLVFFVVGYFIMHDDAFARAAERMCVPALGTGSVLLAASVATWRLQDALPDPSIPLALIAWLEIMAAWAVVVGLVGLGRRFLDRPSRSLGYLAEASYPVYILHQTVIVILGYYLVRLLPSAPLGWPALCALSAMMTFALYEGVRRAGLLRFLFGMKPRP